MQLNYVHITSTFNGSTKTVLPIINEQDAMTEFDRFLDLFDHTWNDNTNRNNM